MIKTQLHDGGICVISPEGDRLTAVSSNQFRQQASQLIDDGHNRLIIDLTQVRFVDSSGLGAIVGLLKRVGNRGEVVICGLTDAVRQMFKITRMERVFATYSDPEAAIAAMER
ncbi:STAS domain-containing protein [Paracoccus sp. (in: a-proteobacteria)]|uniref:STAS domain-containing protein n=1 Tax=Paracoccus sp. TaxID=267 RepID=UPI00396C3697